MDSLVREIYADMKVVRAKTEELAVHQGIANGRLSKLEESQVRQNIQTAEVKGAVGFARWILGATLAVMSVGATVAGVVLGYLVKGG